MPSLYNSITLSQRIFTKQMPFRIPCPYNSIYKTILIRRLNGQLTVGVVFFY